MKKKVKIFGKDIKRAVRRGLMENIVEGHEMKDTYSRADYEATPQETEIGGVFGKYEEDIPPAVLRYMRKNPGQIIKRLYGVYGNKMIEYITNTGKEGSVEFEEEVVSEVEDFAATTGGKDFSYDDLKTKYGEINIATKAGKPIEATETGIKIYNENIGKRITRNEISKLFETQKKTLSEKWKKKKGEGKIVDPKKKGMFKGKNQTELKAMLDKEKAKCKKYQDKDKKCPDSVKEKEAQILFALRAKQDWPEGEGSTKT